jgi:hypothetical protein
MEFCQEIGQRVSDVEIRDCVEGSHLVHNDAHNVRCVFPRGAEVCTVTNMKLGPRSREWYCRAAATVEATPWGGGLEEVAHDLLDVRRGPNSAHEKVGSVILYHGSHSVGAHDQALGHQVQW